MAKTESDKSAAAERRARLKALRDKRRAAAEEAGVANVAEAESADAGGDEKDMRKRLISAIARKRRLQGEGDDEQAAGGRARRGRAGAGRGRAGAGAGRRARGGGGEGAGLQKFPKLREMLAKRRGQGDGEGDEPETQVDRLQKRLDRLTDAVARTEAELQEARINPEAAAGSGPRRKKKAARKKAGGRAQAVRKKAGRKKAVRKKVAATAAKARAARGKAKD